MKIFITKYALTDGIQEREGELEDGGKFAAVKSRGFSWNDHYPIGKEAFIVRSDAVSDADARRLKKIKSLQSQIKKLETMRFQ